MNLLEVNDIHVYIHSFYILQGVSFTVPQGKTTVLLGRNGSGKTTTMRAVLGLNPPRKGSILFKGEEISNVATHNIVKKGIGYVPDTRRIFKNLNVEQNLVLAHRGKTDLNKKLEEIYTLFPDFERFMKQKAGSLSGGQQQMVAVARAMVNDNDLLLIDEPTEGLSPLLAKNVLETIRTIKEKNTVLLVEQNFAAAKAVGDFYYIFDDGRIAHSGKMEDLANDEELVSRYLGVSV